MSPSPSSHAPTRREFLKSTSALSATALAANFAAAPNLYAQDSQKVLKVGLVGCGGRGSGAAANALSADKYTKLVAVADVFPEHIESSLRGLKGKKEISAQVDVTDDMKFLGLDAYKKVIENVDVVLLASPPGFRPWHLRAAVEAGKHIFCEKPMATDAVGVRHAMESVRMAKEKKLSLVAGFCWRYHPEKMALFQQVHDGAIGDVLGVYGCYLTSPVKPMPPAADRPAGMSDLEWMVRNWYNFTFLSGDGIVEQAVHTVDWLAWTMKDVMPVSCTALGGRQVPAHGGNIYDHVEINYLWDNGARGFMAQRQITGCFSETALRILGTTGIAEITGRGSSITGENAWRSKPGDKHDMYELEHQDLFLSIRDGKALNDGDRMMKSTMMAIMGRMAGYTGQQITWDQALNSTENLMPEITSWETPVTVPAIARPGLTKLV
ncbi:MAG TPA: Gfo/Idh/MocA family oxidoreductase [Caulifigura sp.]|nr:Gfo/Idh/MocA family oxidoreductase [Caulifigura sp.]